MNEEQFNRRTELHKSFKPGAPISQLALFAGRLDQLNTIINAINQRGQHVMIFGERGVGKTSIANVLSEFFERQYEDERWLRYVRINCDSSDDYTSIWKKVFRELTYVYERKKIGFAQEKELISSNLVGLVGDSVKPEDIRYIIERLGGLHIVIIDEIDRVQNDEVTALMADTIKTFSDHLINATIILVGVADAVEDLIEEHLSIERSLVQVYMPRMSEKELAEIIDIGVKSAKMKSFKNARKKIVQLSQGLPHYTHLLALHASQRAVDMGRITLKMEDIDGALEKAVEEAQQSIKRKYHQATSSPRETLYPVVLLACALASADELGYFAATDVREPLCRITSKEYDIPAFSRHLYDFCESQRGPVLIKTGVPRRFRFRFINPLIQPFVIMKGLADKLITTEHL